MNNRYIIYLAEAELTMTEISCNLKPISLKTMNESTSWDLQCRPLQQLLVDSPNLGWLLVLIGGHYQDGYRSHSQGNPTWMYERPNSLTSDWWCQRLYEVPQIEPWF